jgi:hypothetical protein
MLLVDELMYVVLQLVFIKIFNQKWTVKVGALVVTY